MTFKANPVAPPVPVMFAPVVAEPDDSGFGDLTQHRHEREHEKMAMQEIRRNALMFRQIETGMIFMEMLGLDDARNYWCSVNIPPSVIERLVNGRPKGHSNGHPDGHPKVHPDGHPDGHPQQASSAPAFASPPAPEQPIDKRISLFYCHAGRRQDLIGAAVVQAAVAIQQELGRERAEHMLRREGLDQAVIERVLSQEGRARRTP